MNSFPIWKCPMSNVPFLSFMCPPSTSISLNFMRQARLRRREGKGRASIMDMFDIKLGSHDDLFDKRIEMVKVSS